MIVIALAEAGSQQRRERRAQANVGVRISHLCLRIIAHRPLFATANGEKRRTNNAAADPLPRIQIQNPESRAVHGQFVNTVEGERLQDFEPVG
jgi:hypothetical protein